MDRNDELFERAQISIPGGVNSPVRAFRSVGGSPRFIERAKGPYMWDATGKRFIDYILSWGPMILGHNNDVVVAQMEAAAERGLSFGAATEAEILIAEEIRKIVPSMEQVRLVSSGTEAGMSAIRLARGYTGRNKIIKFEGCYHGHSDSLLVKAGSGMLTFGNPSSAGVPASVTEHTLVLEYNNPEQLEEAFQKFGDDIACVIVEASAGNMNMVRGTKEFIHTMRELCTKYGALLIVDEVQTGMGRTGSLFSYQQFGIQPDLVSCAKGLGGGLPIGAVLFGEKTETVFVPGDHGSTFGGNPVVCAGAVHILNTMDEAFLQDVQKKGAYLKEKIEKMPHVENVAGLGMMLGIQLDVEAKPVINALLEAGLLVLSAKTKIRLLPPLTITQEELDKGLTILEQTLASL